MQIFSEFKSHGPDVQGSDLGTRCVIYSSQYAHKFGEAVGVPVYVAKHELLWMGTAALPCHQTCHEAVMYLCLHSQQQTSLTKVVIFPCRTQELLVYHGLHWLVYFCYHGTSLALS